MLNIELHLLLSHVNQFKYGLDKRRDNSDCG